MTKLLICDLDGVVANVDARFVKAEEAKQAFLNDAQVRMGDLTSAAGITKQATDIYWRTVFDPENVPLDTLIEGTKEALQTLRYEQRYKLFFLTSRPAETMRLATVEWLLNQNILFYSESGNVALVMKPPAAQYVKTVIWKALTIQMLVALYNADDVLVVDDQLANLSELMKYDTSHMRLCSSLAEAIAPAPEPDVNLDEHPF